MKFKTPVLFQSKGRATRADPTAHRVGPTWLAVRSAHVARPLPNILASV